MVRLSVMTILCLTALPALAADGGASSPTIILSDPASGRTMGKIDGETIILQKTQTGMVGKMGKDKVLLHSDRNGNTVGKVGDRKLFCHSDPVSGLTLCK